MPANTSQPPSNGESTPPTRKPARSGRPGFAHCGILAAIGLLLLCGQTRTPPTAHREIRIFQIVTGMRSTGDYLIPRIEQEPALKKPPLYYWLACLAKSATGLSDRLAFRLPSILSSLALLVCLFGLCRIAGLGHLALSAALILTAFYEFYHNARVADFETMLSLFSLASVCCFYQYLKREKTGWLLLAGLALALGLLTKATPALPMVLIPVFFLYKSQGKARLLLKPKVILLGLILPLLLGMSWYIFMLAINPHALETFAKQGLLPLGVKSGSSKPLHYEGPFFYGYEIFKIAAPAILLLPLLLLRLLRTRAYRGDGQNLRWAFHAFLAVLILFSLLAQKQEHYLLPALPYLAILLADALFSLFEVRRAILFLRIAAYLGIALLLGAALLFGLYFGLVIEHPPLAGLVSMAFLMIAAVSLILVRRQAIKPLLVAQLLGWWLFLGVYYGSFNVWDSQFKTGEVYQRADYSAEHWQGLFIKYPSLKKIFKTSKPPKIRPNDETGES